VWGAGCHLNSVYALLAIISASPRWSRIDFDLFLAVEANVLERDVQGLTTAVGRGSRLEEGGESRAENSSGFLGRHVGVRFRTLGCEP
jgi:hypothetical protein